MILLNQIIQVGNIKGLHDQVEKILELENLSLWQRLNSCEGKSTDYFFLHLHINLTRRCGLLHVAFQIQMKFPIYICSSCFRRPLIFQSQSRLNIETSG